MLPSAWVASGKYEVEDPSRMFIHSAKHPTLPVCTLKYLFNLFLGSFGPAWNPYRSRWMAEVSMTIRALYLKPKWPKPLRPRSRTLHTLLGGSWDLVSMVISTLTGVISTYQ